VSLARGREENRGGRGTGTMSYIQTLNAVGAASACPAPRARAGCPVGQLDWAPPGAPRRRRSPRQPARAGGRARATRTALPLPAAASRRPGLPPAHRRRTHLAGAEEGVGRRHTSPPLRAPPGPLRAPPETSSPTSLAYARYPAPARGRAPSRSACTPARSTSADGVGTTPRGHMPLSVPGVFP